MYFKIYCSGSINGSLETEDRSIQTDEIVPDSAPAISRDHPKTSPQQEAIRTYLSSRRINVGQDAEASGSDSR